MISPHPIQFSIDDYRRIGEIGLLPPGKHVELIFGQIVEMSPKGAEASIPNYWIFNLVEHQLEVYAHPKLSNGIWSYDQCEKIDRLGNVDWPFLDTNHPSRSLELGKIPF